MKKAGKKELLLGNDSNPGDHKVPVEGVEHDNDYVPGNYNQSILIEVAPLDTIIQEYDIVPNYIEIMVNGAEFEILKGATNTLSNSNLKLLIKGHQRSTATGDPLNRQISDFLQERGFQTTIGASTSKTVGNTGKWKRRSGDVYAWKGLS